eukprot:TRINITY_DN868_c0_g2_i1.p1 TRINITY_DN868_c0_g2~~TRINITY_DN868_c0_g2_i1.p1  ORF type:complete len:800 (+),score=184.86 TRINITY_DN868_c0_g2_i1:228-2627(+)
MPPPSGPYRFGGPGPPGVRVRLPIHKRIKVYWSGMKQWYSGTICDWDASKGLHFIHYDDGEIYRIKLGNTIWDWEDSEAPPLKLPGNVKATPVKRRPKFKQSGNREGKGEEKDDQLMLLDAPKSDVNSDTEEDEGTDAGRGEYDVNANGKRTRRPSALMKEIYGEPSGSKEKNPSSLDDGETLATNAGSVREVNSHGMTTKQGGAGELRRNTGSKSGRCHQCHRDKRGEVARCKTCNHFRFCTACIANRYNLTKEEVEEKCPKCRGNCNCGRCMSNERAVKKEPKLQQLTNTSSTIPLYMRRQPGVGFGNRDSGSAGDEPVLQDFVSQLGCAMPPTPAHTSPLPSSPLLDVAAATTASEHANPIASETSPILSQAMVYPTPLDWEGQGPLPAYPPGTSVKDEVESQAAQPAEVILLDQVAGDSNGNGTPRATTDLDESGQFEGTSKVGERPKTTKVRTRTTNENVDMERISRLRRGGASGMMLPPRESRQASLVYHSSAEVRFVGPLKRPMEVRAKFGSSRPRSVRHTADRAADSSKGGTGNANDVDRMDADMGGLKLKQEEEDEGSCRNGVGKELVVRAESGGDQDRREASLSGYYDDVQGVETCEGEVESGEREENGFGRKVAGERGGRGEHPTLDMMDDGNDLAAEALIGMATSPGLIVPELKSGFVGPDALALSAPQPVVMPGEGVLNTSPVRGQNLVVVREEEMMMAALKGDKQKRNEAYMRVLALGGVSGFLKSLGLEKYERVFKENEVMDDTLPLLTHQDLRDMCLSSVGARRKILTGIQDLWNNSSYTSTA